jgi:hypothetical protein
MRAPKQTCHLDRSVAKWRDLRFLFRVFTQTPEALVLPASKRMIERCPSMLSVVAHMVLFAHGFQFRLVEGDHKLLL